MKYLIVIILIGGAILGYIYIRKTPEVAPIAYEPYALLCSGEYEYFTPGGTDCFSITREGKSFASTSVTLGLKFFGEISSTSKFSDVADTVDGIAKEVEIMAVSIVENDEYVIHTKIGKILITGDNLAMQLSNILAFLRERKQKTFEYIDARHGSSIFFK